MDLDIVFDRTGGFAGLCLRAAVTADQLDTGQAVIAEQLFAEPPGPSSPGPSSAGPTAAAVPEPGARPTRFPPPGPFAADAFTYRLELRSGSRIETFEWPDPEVPSEIRPLLSALTRRATPVDPAPEA